MSAFLGLVALAFGEPRLSVEGSVGKRHAYTNAELRQSFAADVRDVPFTLKGMAGHAHALPLKALLDAAAPKVDAKRKHAPLAQAVVATGPDGYTVVFSMGEMGTDWGKREVWVALDWDDKPLTGDDAPARLIVPQDEKPSRWVHGVRTLRVVDLAPKRR